MVKTVSDLLKLSCRRQDSNLRHRLLQRKLSIRARYPPKAPSCQVLSHTELSGTFPLFPNDFRH